MSTGNRTEWAEPANSTMKQSAIRSPALSKRLQAIVEEFRDYFCGYSHSEISAAFASYLSGGRLLLIGKHGRGKSSFARALAQVANHSFVSYDASKADSNSMAGFLDPRRAKANEGLPFIRHNMTLWKKEVVFFDELSRAPAANQNALLEILEEGSLFGWELDKLQFVIAAANSGAGYFATMELDAALFDRFSTVIFIREEGLCEEIVQQLINKPTAHFQPSVTITKADRVKFRQAIDVLKINYQPVLGRLAGDFLLTLESMTDYRFSDRNVLQFRDAFFGQWAMQELLGWRTEIAIEKAFESAARFTLLNRARSLTPNDVQHSTAPEVNVTRYLMEQAMILAEQVALSQSTQNTPVQLAGLMFVGTAAQRLDTYERHAEEIGLDDIARQNSALALEKIINTGTPQTLRRICQSGAYPNNFKVEAEFQLLRGILDSAVSPVSDGRNRFPFRKTISQLRDSQDLRRFSLVKEDDLDSQVEDFEDTANRLKLGGGYQCHSQGLLLARYPKGSRKPQVPATLPLPSFARAELSCLQPYLYKLDEGQHFQLFGVVPHQNGTRQGGSFEFVEADIYFLVPKFALATFFAECRTIELPRAMRATTTSPLATQIRRLILTRETAMRDERETAGVADGVASGVAP